MSDYNPPSDRFSTFRAGREELVKTLAEARRTKLEEEVKEFEEKVRELLLSCTSDMTYPNEL